MLRHNSRNSNSFVPKVESLERLSLVSALDFGVPLMGKRGKPSTITPLTQDGHSLLAAPIRSVVRLNLSNGVAGGTGIPTNIASTNIYVGTSKGIPGPSISTSAPTISMAALSSATSTADLQEPYPLLQPNVITITSPTSIQQPRSGGALVTPGVDPVGNILPSIAQTNPFNPVVSTPRDTSPAQTAGFVSGGFESNEIRPMSLPPTTNHTSSAAHTLPTLFDDMSGGGPPVHNPPTLTFSGGGAGAIPVLDGSGNPIPGQFKAAQPIPIGSIVVATTSDYTPGSSANPSYLWGGGTNYSGYFSTPGWNNADPSVSLVQNVDPTQPSYQFIVDATPRPYQILLHESFTDGGSTDATLTFTSDAPTATESTIMSNQTFVADGSGGGTVGMSNPMFIQASSAKTDAYTAGSFMFLQIVNNAYLESTNRNNGAMSYKKNNMTIDGQNFNGPLHDFELTGYSHVWDKDPIPRPYYQQWHGDANASLPSAVHGFPFMGDTVQFTSSAGGNYSKISLVTNFSSYIMYQPDAGGVWIALCQINWTETETATVQGGVLSGPTSNQAPATGGGAPTGNAAFPVWVNIAQTFLNANSQSGDPGP